MDDSRKHDLEELMELRRSAPDRIHREEYDRIIEKIMREGRLMRSARTELIQAIRNGDRRHVRYMQEYLRKLAKDQDGGRETLKI